MVHLELRGAMASGSLRETRFHLGCDGLGGEEFGGEFWHEKLPSWVRLQPSFLAGSLWGFLVAKYALGQDNIVASVVSLIIGNAAAFIKIDEAIKHRET
jgi:hypothetical protein